MLRLIVLAVLGSAGLFSSAGAQTGTGRGPLTLAAPSRQPKRPGEGLFSAG
jgi:hypothetical protein